MTGIDSSSVGIGQMLRIATEEGFDLEGITEKDFNYTFTDPGSDHRSVTPYKMLAYQKTDD